MKIKICGMNNLNNLSALESLKPDYFGFIFYPKSPRNFKGFQLPNFKDIKKVGVFVNESIARITKLQKEFQLDAIQLHGDETKEDVLNLKSKLPPEIEIFKAISINDKEDFKKVTYFEDKVDIFILDTKTKLRGGSGKKFEWHLLEYYNSKTPFLLSGGIQENDAYTVMEVFNTYDNMLGVDINSKFEVSPGLKDKTKIEKFIKNINEYAVRG
jgi:phosphoribosylanthranilate isomerase